MRLKFKRNNAVGAQFVRCNKIKLKFETTATATTTDRQKEAVAGPVSPRPLAPSGSLSLCLSTFP